VGERRIREFFFGMVEEYHQPVVTVSWSREWSGTITHMDISNWKNEYDEGKTNECPCCGQDRPTHTCRECHNDIAKVQCWKDDGYCSRDYQYIHIEIPKIHAEKDRLGVECKCDDPACSKCLIKNCKDDHCPVHTMEEKIRRRRTSKE